MHYSHTIKISSLKYSYRKETAFPVLNGIDLTAGENEYILLCGASGSGKSTLCRTLNGLIPHFYGGSLEGYVRIAGVDTTIRTVGDMLELVGMVFQNPEAQLFCSTVVHEIAFGLESLGLAPSAIKSRVKRAAERLSIADLLHSNPHNLSDGEKQLSAIAAATALSPKLIVLDEPYANLDPSNVQRVRCALKEIRRQGICIVIAEHRLHYTLPDVDRVAVIHDGRIVIDTPPVLLLPRHVKRYGLEFPLSGPEKEKIEIPGPPPGAETVLSVENISFSRNGTSLLKDISFTLRKGECIAVLGANGAGKTTLLKHINGLYRPDKGKITLMELDTSQKKIPELARYAGIAIQNPDSQFFKLNVRDEISAGAVALNCYDEKWINRLVDLFGLEKLLKRAPYRLSGGEKKRVAFASALAAKPAVLALDEPTAGQDARFRSALSGFLSELTAEGIAVLLVTHDLLFAKQNAHRFLLMAKGKIISKGTPGRVISDKMAMRLAGLLPAERMKDAA
ncbi:MAG: ATP-binding cassette domain-containing protein [Desulfobacterales bacterium]|nr:ATP-binding cassette domain-containing protein [Desulfobacterales bacterium]